MNHRASEDRWAEFVPAQLPDAFLEERRDDSGKALTGPDVPEIFDPLAARRPDVAHPQCLSKYPSPRLDWPQLDAALAGRLVLEPSLWEQRPASPRSDVCLGVHPQRAAQMELQRGAPERHSE